MARVTIVGAGVVGLTTGVVLRGRGHDVRIVADRTGDQTTSSKAGAVWFPFKADPPDLVNAWARASRAWLTDLVGRPAAGVDLLRLFECADSPERPWWADAAPDLELTASPTAAAAYCWTLLVPRVVPLLHLSYLEALCGPIERRSVSDLRQECAHADWVVNCTGLGARALTGDRALRAALGQTVIVEPGTIDLAHSIEDDRDLDALFYSIPRRDSVVLGGVAIPVDDCHPAEPDPAIAAAILSRCQSYGVHPGAVIRHSCGLRPCREGGVRLEVDFEIPRVIHNYGHGGAGFTLAAGCAQAVANIIQPA